MPETKILLKRGNESNRSTVTPMAGELLVTTDERKLYVGDGTTAGGQKIATTCYQVADSAGMLGLTDAIIGEIALKQDDGTLHVLTGLDPTDSLSWTPVYGAVDKSSDIIQSTNSLLFNDNARLKIGSTERVEHFFEGADYYMDVLGASTRWLIRDSWNANSLRFTFDLKLGRLSITGRMQAENFITHAEVIPELAETYYADISAESSYAMLWRRNGKSGKSDEFIGINNLSHLIFRQDNSEEDDTYTDHRVYHEGFKPTHTDVGLGNINDWASTDVLENTPTKYASAASAYAAYTTAKSDILGGTPSEQLDTLTELAAALNDNEDAIVAINASLANKSDITHDHDDRYALAGTYNSTIGTDNNINTSGSTVIDTLTFDQGVCTGHSTRTLSAVDLKALTTDSNDVKSAGSLQFADTIPLSLGGSNNVLHTYNGADYVTDISGSAQWLIRDADDTQATRFTFDTASGDLSVSGVLAETSDGRLKTDIVQITDALETVKQLRGVRYRRSDLKSNATHIGLVAQEVRPILPEVVNVDSSIDEYLSVSYSNLVAVLVESIKELSEKVDTQQRQIGELLKK